MDRSPKIAVDDLLNDSAFASDRHYTHREELNCYTNHLDAERYLVNIRTFAELWCMNVEQAIALRPPMYQDDPYLPPEARRLLKLSENFRSQSNAPDHTRALSPPIEYLMPSPSLTASSFSTRRRLSDQTDELDDVIDEDEVMVVEVPRSQSALRQDRDSSPLQLYIDPALLPGNPCDASSSNVYEMDEDDDYDDAASEDCYQPSDDELRVQAPVPVSRPRKSVETTFFSMQQTLDEQDVNNLPADSLAGLIVPYITVNYSASKPETHAVQKRDCFVCGHANGLGRDRRSAERHFESACTGPKAVNSYLGDNYAPTRRELVVGLHTAIALRQVKFGLRVYSKLSDSELELVAKYPHPHLKDGDGITSPTELVSRKTGGLDGRLDWWDAFETWGHSLVTFCSLGCGFHALRCSSVKRHEVVCLRRSKRK